jgi:hypothetical protein
VTKKSASCASVDVLSVRNENGSTELAVRRRVATDPSHFSPLFPSRFLSTTLQTAPLSILDDGDERKRVQCHGRCFAATRTDLRSRVSCVVVLLRSTASVPSHFCPDLTFVAFPFLFQTLPFSSTKWIACSGSKVSVFAVFWSIPYSFPFFHDGFVPVVRWLYYQLLSHLCFTSFLFNRRPKRSSTFGPTKVSTVPTRSEFHFCRFVDSLLLSTLLRRLCTGCTVQCFLTFVSRHSSLTDVRNAALLNRRWRWNSKLHPGMCCCCRRSSLFCVYYPFGILLFSHLCFSLFLSDRRPRRSVSTRSRPRMRSHRTRSS